MRGGGGGGCGGSNTSPMSDLVYEVVRTMIPGRTGLAFDIVEDDLESREGLGVKGGLGVDGMGTG